MEHQSIDTNDVDPEKGSVSDTPELNGSEELGKPISKTVTAQDWTGPDDPENPLNWPMWKRCYNSGITGLLCFAVTFGSSIYAPGFPGVQEEFGVSSTVALLPLSLYVLASGAGPALAAPISETYGRRIVYWTSVPLSMVFTLGAGWSQTLPQLVICRFFAALFGSPVLAVGSGTNADLWPPQLRGVAVSFFLMCPFLGPAFGPLVGGFSVMRFSWRWTQWDILFVTLPIFVASLFMTETYKKIILKRRAKRLNIAKPPETIPTSKLAMLKVLLTVTLARPVHMIFTEPIVGYLSLYIAFNFAVLFAFFAAFPIVFEGIYNFNPGESGLAFLGVGLGVLLCVPASIFIDQRFYKPRHAEVLKAGKNMVDPEHRLYGAMVGSFGVPIGLFWFAWTARKDIRWISPVLASVPFGFGNMMIFISAALYLIDVYGPLWGASALGGNGLLRYAFGAAFPLFTIPMYQNLGVDWATSLFGFISVAMLPIPWIIFKYGPKIRARSSYDTARAWA